MVAAWPGTGERSVNLPNAQLIKAKCYYWSWNVFFQGVKKSLRGNPKATGSAVVSRLLSAATEGGCWSLILHSAKGENGIIQIYWVWGSVFQCAHLIRVLKSLFSPKELLLLYRPSQSFHKESPFNYKVRTNTVHFLKFSGAEPADLSTIQFLLF